MLQAGSTTDRSLTKGKYDRRFDEECKREVADLASKPGAEQEQVARDPGVSPSNVARWKKQDATALATACSGVNTQELERENRALRRENEDLRGQGALSKKPLAVVSEAPRAGRT